MIGFSFAVPDKEWLVSLLQSNPEATKIIINPHTREICEDLGDDATRISFLASVVGEAR